MRILNQSEVGYSIVSVGSFRWLCAQITCRP